MGSMWEKIQQQDQRGWGWSLLVSGRSQRQNNGVRNLQHGLKNGGHDDEEDDAEQERTVNHLKLYEAGLHCQDQQSDSFRHPPDRQTVHRSVHAPNAI